MRKRVAMAIFAAAVALALCALLDVALDLSRSAFGVAAATAALIGAALHADGGPPRRDVGSGRATE
jgi:hypothetical protein